jgi:WD40-like Beta Propeller Repeat
MLIERGSDAHYVRSGHLVYALGGSLFAVAFDVERLEVVGDAAPVLEGVQRSASGSILSGAAQFSVSDTGTIVYIPGPSTAATLVDLAIVTRQGTVKPLNLPPGPYESPRMSPDGTRVAFAADDGKEAAIYVSELSGAAAPQRITFQGRSR